MVVIQEEILISFKGLTGGWTKWGGRRYELITDRQDSELADVWNCQSCGTQQPKELNPYKYEYPEKEYIRVCAECFANKCEKLKKRLLSP